jgi:hypothetical protein
VSKRLPVGIVVTNREEFRVFMEESGMVEDEIVCIAVSEEGAGRGITLRGVIVFGTVRRWRGLPRFMHDLWRAVYRPIKVVV